MWAYGQKTQLTAKFFNSQLLAAEIDRDFSRQPITKFDHILSNLASFGDVARNSTADDSA